MSPDEIREVEDDPVDRLRGFLRFYRITSVYLCVVATIVLALLLTERYVGWPDAADVPGCSMPGREGSP